MTDDGLALFHIFLLIIMAIVGMIFGFVAGHEVTLGHATDSLCKQIKTETSEYLACKQKEFSEVIKEIK